MRKRQYCFYFVQLLVAAIDSVNLGQTMCFLPFSNEIGKCVSLQECTTLKVSSDFANPDLFQEITYRSESCRALNSKMICCETNSILNRADEVKIDEEIVSPMSSNGSFEAHENYKLFDNDKCGLTTTNRISNGENAGLFQYPWAARLGYTNNEDAIKFLCGATLISDFYVLTAAHCLVHVKGGNILKIVRLGEYDDFTDIDCIDDTSCSDPIQDIDVESIIPHPKYDRNTIENDIGLVRLANTANFNQNNIKPICLPFDPNTKRIGKKFTVVGWGRTENNTNSHILQRAFVPEYDSRKCEQKFSGMKKNFKIANSQICAGGNGKTDACRGDSGSSLEAPAMVNKNIRSMLYGVVSFGVKFCGNLEGYPGIYTRVSEYTNWIMDNMH